MPQKKAKRKAQHQKAIAGYREWEKKHPKATHQEKFNMFDSYVDSSLLEEVFQDAIQASAA